MLQIEIHFPTPTEVEAGQILQMFGKMFFEFCQESGYDTILRVLGSNVREFLQVRGCGFHFISIKKINVKIQAVPFSGDLDPVPLTQYHFT